MTNAGIQTVVLVDTHSETEPGVEVQSVELTAVTCVSTDKSGLIDELE